ncbi:MAG: putative methylase [Thermococcaceae archaeon]|jgi:putative methylase|uniref:METTL5 family protein n=1 Tax=Thermococcus TaxID=2263 RepID=UPI0005B2BEEA|nr:MULTISPECIES: METTL5 family protein [Thermococcus]KUJ99099.1 MAG: DNA methylase [Thermococcales archaeon 44_46]MDK2854280.1 putative methylase [Thermococcaceae archaeon]MCA6213441.1 methyltransferase [Thermococcus bergensis]MDK2984155.1 putative methylase [Thermococcaceae archaeon]MDN5321504.1 putative methylase [Thermococcaceae archaeon]
MKKKHLAIILSKLKGFEEPKPELEQYRTPGDVAAELLWLAHSMGDIEGKIIADLGAGTGVLSIGASLMGAKKVYAVEKDKKALEIAMENAKTLNITNIEFVNAPVEDFNVKVDTVIMNPPFGSQNPKADRPFLLKAFDVSDVVYSIHLAKEEVRKFIEAFVKDNGFKITHRLTLPFEIPAQFFFHRKRLERILVDIYRFERD